MRKTILVDFSSDAPEAPTDPKRYWYGWQILLGLAGSYTLLIGGLAAEESTVAVVGGLGHFMAGPITHWGNGMVARGFLSLGLNLGVPFGASLVGAGLGALADNNGALTGWLFGGALGFIAAPIIDVAAVAYKPISPENEETTSAPRLHLTPILGQGRTGLSLSGQF